MTRCGGTAGGCTCSVAAGTGITVTGDGSVQTPYTVTASGSGVSVQAADTGTVDTAVTGAGTTANPYRVSGAVKISGDPENGLATGSDGGLFAQAAPGGVILARGTVVVGRAFGDPPAGITVDVDGGPAGATANDNDYYPDAGDRVLMLLVSDGTYVVIG